MSYVPVDMHGGPSIYANFTPGDVASAICGATVDAYNFGVKHKLWGDGTYIGGRKRSQKRHRNNDDDVTSISSHYSETRAVEYEDIDDADITDENGIRHYKSDTMEIEGPIEKYYDGFGNLASMYDAENDIYRVYNNGRVQIEENYKTGYTTFFDDYGSIVSKVHDLDEDEEEDSDEEEDIEDESCDKKLFSSLIINHITFMNKQGYILSKIDMVDDEQSVTLTFDNNDTDDHRVCTVSLH